MMDGERMEADVVLVGGGLAGCVAAKTLAEAGLSVALFEAGPAYEEPPPPPSFVRKVLTKLGLAPPRKIPDRWPDTLEFYPKPGGKGRDIPAVLGQGLGGSSLIYAAAMERLRRVDFERDDSETIAGSLPNAWPVGYDDFRPYYRQAEALMRLVGTRDPLDPDDDAELGAPPPVSPRDAALAEDLLNAGMHPHRMHVGFDYRPGCSECIARRCPRGCKADGESRALGAALATGRVTLIQGAAGNKVTREDGGLTVWATLRDGGQAVVHGKRVVLAAGALNSPLILERSPGIWRDGQPPAMLGRGLMFHISDVFAVFPKHRAAGFGPLKTLAFRDFYDVDGVAYGEVQSMGFVVDTGHVQENMKARLAQMGFGFLGPALEFLRPISWLGAKFLKGSLLYATIMEDHPLAENRVWSAGPAGAEAPAGRIALAYQPSRELRKRARQLRRMCKRAFKPNRLVFLTGQATPNWGHPLGTCRMGTDPAISVTDPNGRVWGADDIYVADASTFPSSGGANPSLTVVANALRVAEAVAADVNGSGARPAERAAA